jgi:phage-related protein
MGVMVKPLTALAPVFELLGNLLAAMLKPLEMFANLLEKVAGIISKVTGPVDEAQKKFDEFTNGIKEAANGFAEKAGAFFSEAGDSVKGFFGFADGGMISRAGSTVGSAPVPIIAHVGEAILNGEQQNKVAEALNKFMGTNLMPTLKGAFSAFNKVDDMLGGFGSKIGSMFGDTISGVLDNTSDLLGVDAKGVLSEATGGIFDDLFGFGQGPAAPTKAGGGTMAIGSAQLTQVKEVNDFVAQFNDLAYDMDASLNGLGFALGNLTSTLDQLVSAGSLKSDSAPTAPT